MNQIISNEEYKRKHFSLQTYLSSQVNELIQPALECLRFQINQDERSQIWSNKTKCILNIDYLHSKVIKHDDDLKIDFLQSIRNLAPYLDPIKLDLISNIDLKRHASRFLQSNLDLFSSHVLLANQTLSHLTLFSVFERCLGDLYSSLSPNCQVPFLLRDLLNESALESFLGSSCMDFLKLLLCGPKSLNLRNLAWHGFLNPNQYSDHLRYFLIALIVLIDSKLELITVNERPKYKLTNLRPLELNRVNLEAFRNKLGLNFSEIILKSVIIDESRRNLWLSAVLSDDCFVRMIVLLPEIEHVLRKFYSCANKIEDNSCQIAFTNEFYLTMDDLIASPELVSSLDPKLVVLMFDLFNYVDGPRIRDRLSHGEIDSRSIDSYYSDLVVLVSLALVSSTNLLDFLSYEPNFHPIAVLKNEFTQLGDGQIQTNNEYF